MVFNLSWTILFLIILLTWNNFYRAWEEAYLLSIISVFVITLLFRAFQINICCYKSSLNYLIISEIDEDFYWSVFNKFFSRCVNMFIFFIKRLNYFVSQYRNFARLWTCGLGGNLTLSVANRCKIAVLMLKWCVP